MAKVTQDEHDGSLKGLEKELEEKYRSGAIEKLIHTKLSRILTSLGLEGDDRDVDKSTEEGITVFGIKENPIRFSDNQSEKEIHDKT